MLYLGAGVLGSATSLAYSNTALSAGASGAIFGIIGAGVAMAVWNRNRPEMRGQLRSWIFLIAINVFIGIQTPRIDLRAHIGGLIGGFVIASAFEASVRQRGAARAALQIAGYTVVAVASYVLTSAHVI
jgi:rhomboid protease GluP